jgi:hypothetical protein
MQGISPPIFIRQSVEFFPPSLNDDGIFRDNFWCQLFQIGWRLEVEWLV